MSGTCEAVELVPIALGSLELLGAVRERPWRGIAELSFAFPDGSFAPGDLDASESGTAVVFGAPEGVSAAYAIIALLRAKASPAASALLDVSLIMDFLHICERDV